MKWALLGLAGCTVIFGSICIITGSDGVVISAVFGLLGTIGGYIFGSESKKD